MIQNIFKSAFIFLCFGALAALSAQTPANALKPSVIPGDVVSINQVKIVVNAKDGQIEALITPKTEYKRVLPDNPSLSAAAATTFADIGVGDKVVVTGVLSADKKSLPARTVYLMTKSDISQKHAKEAAEWKTRGINGKVTAVNPGTNQVTVEISGGITSAKMVLTPKDKATFLRYAPDSVRFDEAKASSLSEIMVGDQLKALGDKSSDGSSFAADEIITGAFQTVAGTVKTVDVEKSEIVISDFQTKKDVTVSLAGAAVVKRFPAEMAERMAGLQTGGARPVGPGGAQPPATEGRGQTPGGQGQNPGGRQGFAGRGGGGIDDMLDRFPNITVADLKA